MDQGQDTAAEKSTTRSKIYLAIAIGLLVLLALSWSISASFIYIFLGGAAFFFFLALRNRPATKPEGETARQAHRTYGHKQSTTAFADDLRAIFGKKKTGFQSTAKNMPASRRIVLVVWIFIMSVFTIIFLSVVFNPGNSSTYDAAGYEQQGDQFYATAQYDSAYRNYKRALQRDPDFEGAYCGIGNIMLANNQHDSALFYFSKALAINPEFSQAAYGRASVYYNQQNYTEAVKEATALLEKDPSYFDALLLAGDCYYVQKQYDEAIGYYEDAYEAGARSKELCYIMAYIYDERGDMTRAISMYQETLQYDSAIPDIYRRLGELLPGDEGNVYRNKLNEKQW